MGTPGSQNQDNKTLTFVHCYIMLFSIKSCNSVKILMEASFIQGQQSFLLHHLCLSAAPPMPRPPSALPTLLGIPHRPLAQLAPAHMSFVCFPLRPPAPFCSLILSHCLKPPVLTPEKGKTVKVMSLDEIV